MHNELTNLLPQERQRMLSRNYVLKIGVIIAVLVTVLTFSAGVLLIPTYVFLNGSANAKKINLAHIESTLSSTDEVALRERLATLSTNAANLLTLSDAVPVSALIRDILSIPRPGITLSELSFTPSAGNNSETMVVSGSSATRDALRSYQLALQGASFIRSAVLPVSAYAKDSDIAFIITITLAL
ncbi:MAG: hypothetical protein Q7R58_01065 [bacterium]|nr:hypothetical protein [bacterium]